MRLGSVQGAISLLVLVQKGHKLSMLLEVHGAGRCLPIRYVCLRLLSIAGLFYQIHWLLLRILAIRKSSRLHIADWKLLLWS